MVTFLFAYLLLIGNKRKKMKNAAAFKIVTIEKTGIEAVCPRCTHRWVYLGVRDFSNCPKCHSTITFRSWKDHQNQRNENKGGQNQ